MAKLVIPFTNANMLAMARGAIAESISWSSFVRTAEWACSVAADEEPNEPHVTDVPAAVSITTDDLRDIEGMLGGFMGSSSSYHRVEAMREKIREFLKQQSN